MRKHILITNDFPPKIGGIQSYLWELWRRLPDKDFCVYTTPFSKDKEFDSKQPFRTIRSNKKVLLPTPSINKNLQRLKRDLDAELIVWDPAFPLGILAPQTRIPYALVIHGAELAIPGKLPIAKSLLANTLKKASLVICAGNYPAEEAERIAKQSLPIAVIAPGVDIERFSPANIFNKEKIRKDFEIPNNANVILALTRLVPRKGIDVLIEAFKILESYYKPGEFNKGRQKMVWMPENAELILNPTSGAPGFSVKNVFCLPGVPSILKSMLGGLKNRIVGGQPILSHTISLRTVESEIASSLTKVQNKNKEVEIGSYPFFHAGKLGVSIVLRSEDQSKIDHCNSQILEFIEEKKIEIVDR